LSPRLQAVSHPGPLALRQGQPNRADLQPAARITVRHGHGRTAPLVHIEAVRGDHEDVF
jgi:hypothetical protein